jgi:hypothetical protein
MNIAQTALQQFEDNFKTVDWTAKTAAQKQTFVLQHYGLKIDAAKEIEANRIAEESKQVTNNAARKTKLVEQLKSRGYACDNSKEDWYKVYDRPHIFGANWQKQAEYQMSISTGPDYFINTVINLIEEIK